jgi:hypothetical protein
MLSDQGTELLTAFVDGELSQRQRKAVMRVLHKSSEAREFLRQLQENAHKVKQLPRRKVEPSLVDAVMQAIAEGKSQTKQPAAPSVVRRRRWLPYLSAAMAASLLVGVISIFAWKAFKDQQEQKGGGGTVVKSGDKKPERKPTPDPEPAPPRSNPLLGQIVEGTFAGAAKLPVADGPFVASFAALQPAKGAKLADFGRIINRNPAVHLDITVKSNSVAMDRLKDALKYRGITLITDQSAAKSLAGKNQAKVEYLVYAENLSADELTKLMSELSQSYVIPGTKNQKNAESPYQKVTVAPIAQDEKQKVAKLLGVDPATLEPKGKNGKSEEKRMAVVLPTAAGSQPSAEVRQFVNQRRQPTPGAVQVLIKIHQE